MKHILGISLVILIAVGFGAYYDQRTDIMGGDAAEVQALPEVRPSNQFKISTGTAATSVYTITSATSSSGAICTTTPIGATVISGTF